MIVHSFSLNRECFKTHLDVVVSHFVKYEFIKSKCTQGTSLCGTAYFQSLCLEVTGTSFIYRY